MNWDAVVAISDLVGALVLVLTLFYLAIQIRQANNHGRRNEIAETFQQFSVARMAIAQNEDLAELLVRGSDNYADLGGTEQLRFENLMSERFWCWHSIWDGIQLHAFEDDFWSGGEILIKQWLERKGIAEWWKIHKYQFPSDYIKAIDELAAN